MILQDYCRSKGKRTNMEEYLRTYCEIDLKAIRENYINIKKKTGDNAMTMAVIKADGLWTWCSGSSTLFK